MKKDSIPDMVKNKRKKQREFKSAYSRREGGENSLLSVALFFGNSGAQRKAAAQAHIA